jgi:hypothetical protein
MSSVPAFNLDLLQSLPGLMARHWLVRRERWSRSVATAPISTRRWNSTAAAHHRRARFGSLAHLDEPLLITEAASLEENAHERQALLRHLGNRGYKAKVTSAVPGIYQIDYRHVIAAGVDHVPASDDLSCNAAWKACCCAPVISITKS